MTDIIIEIRENPQNIPLDDVEAKLKEVLLDLGLFVTIEIKND